MKFLYIFLIISIFTQAHKVCASGTCGARQKMEEMSNCSMDDAGTKSCCHKSKHSQKDSEDEDKHDAGSCKCLCCLKVFLPAHSLQIEIVENSVLPVKNLTFRHVDEYGFDYNYTFYHPPQNLS